MDGGNDEDNKKTSTAVLPLVALREFMKLESASGILLVAAGVLALVAANTPLFDRYELLLQTPIRIQVGTFALLEALLFMVILGLGLAYAWRKHALEWK